MCARTLGDLAVVCRNAAQRISIEFISVPWTVLVADCSYIEPARQQADSRQTGRHRDARAGPDAVQRFACQSRIPASFAMGFIPAITLRIYPPPPVSVSPLPPSRPFLPFLSSLFGVRPLQIPRYNCCVEIVSSQACSS